MNGTNNFTLVIFVMGLILSLDAFGQGKLPESEEGKNERNK